METTDERRGTQMGRDGTEDREGNEGEGSPEPPAPIDLGSTTFFVPPFPSVDSIPPFLRPVRPFAAKSPSVQIREIRVFRSRLVCVIGGATRCHARKLKMNLPPPEWVGIL